MNNKWYIVEDIDGFILSTRRLLFNNFGKNDNESSGIDAMFKEIKKEEQEEFDSVLTQEESLIIAKGLMKKQKNKTTNHTRYVLTDEIYMQIIENMNDRMVSNILNSLVNRGLVEAAFDDEVNDFVFWVKNDEQEKPETD